MHMRRCDDPIEVRIGHVGDLEAPEQFLWQNRLWQVRGVRAQWAESGAWWNSPMGPIDGGAPAAVLTESRRVTDTVTDLPAEREIWRVEAAHPGRSGVTSGVFELTLSWSTGTWTLTGSLD